MIPFNQPVQLPQVNSLLYESVRRGCLHGDGWFNKKCSRWIENHFKISHAMLTPSCTAALELSALLLDLQPGDEVILPSFTFSSTANAFALRGAKLVFVDIRPDTMNIDERRIEEAITKRTRCIVPVHYGGIACEMNDISSIAEHYHIAVVEDAAQGVMAFYDGLPLGTIGDMGCYSFHDSKNYSMGEGGAFLTNNQQMAERAEIIREKGTNRSQFMRGQVDKYTWKDIGASYLASDLSAAYLYAQLEFADEINEDRIKSWNLYYEKLKPLQSKEWIDLPYVPEKCKHNAHLFYIKSKDIEERTQLMVSLRSKNIESVFHYIPLHTSPAGKRFGEFSGKENYTTRESERLLRLPLWYGLQETQIQNVVDAITEFYRCERRTS